MTEAVSLPSNANEKAEGNAPASNSRRTVLVTDGEERSALAVVRSLGRAGYRCIVASATGRSLAGSSRFAELDLRIPPSSTQPSEFATAIQHAIDTHAVDLLLPISESALLALLPVRESLRVRLPFPALDVFERICDKATVLEASQSLGIRVPRQQVIRDAADAAGVPLPTVLKPARSVFTDADGRRGKTTVTWARTPAELRSAMTSYPAAAYPILAQEVIDGPGVGVFVLLAEDGIKASYSHRRLREKPPSGGVSVLRRSEPMRAELLERTIALLQRLGWTGIAMVEYKLDSATDEPVLMEINGRFWGSLQLAIDAGVDFPRIVADLSFGDRIAPVKDYRTVWSRWFWGDVDHVIALWRDSRASFRQRVRAVAGFIRAASPDYRSEVLRLDDPAPFFHESKLWIRDVVR
ncbi:MAG TPA: ATP-grasp domain-containing protein [Longimicrobiales bacterium]